MAFARAVKSKNWTYMQGNKVDSLLDIKQLDSTNQEKKDYENDGRRDLRKFSKESKLFGRHLRH